MLTDEPNAEVAGLRKEVPKAGVELLPKLPLEGNVPPPNMLLTLLEPEATLFEPPRDKPPKGESSMLLSLGLGGVGGSSCIESVNLCVKLVASVGIRGALDMKAEFGPGDIEATLESDNIP